VREIRLGDESKQSSTEQAIGHVRILVAFIYTLCFTYGLNMFGKSIAGVY
jgi:ABC-type Na+ efflux pump permease subunit